MLKNFLKEGEEWETIHLENTKVAQTRSGVPHAKTCQRMNVKISWELFEMQVLIPTDKKVTKKCRNQ